MRNIRQPIARILLNKVTVNDIGVYGDEEQGRRMLKFKKLGIAIPGIAHTATTNALTAGGALSPDLEVSKSTSDDGIYKGWLVELNPMAPAELSYWGYDITLKGEVKLPGVRNNKHDQHSTSYAGEIAAVTTTAGYVDDNYVLSAEDDIIQQIYLDTGAHNINQNAISKMSGAVCDAKRLYRITLGSGNSTLAITDEDGTATEVVLSTAGMASAEVINADGVTKLYVQAWAVSATQIMVASRSNGTLFTVADAGGSTALTIENRYIMLTAKDQEVKFDVELDPSVGTLSGFHYYSISGTTTVGSGTTIVTVEGTASGASTDLDDQANNAAAINTVIGTATFTNIYASYDSYGNGTPIGIIWSSDANRRIQFTFSATSTSVLVDQYSYYARFPSLTADDVHRMFSTYAKAGKLTAFVYSDNAIDGEDYVLYTMSYSADKISALHGQSYDSLHTREVHLYVLASAIDDDIYDANLPNDQRNMIDEDHVTAGNDTNLEELLAVWAGVAPSVW